MAKSKPEVAIRKPPKKEADPDELEAFVKGSDGAENQDTGKGRDDTAEDSEAPENAPSGPGVVQYADGSYARRMTVYFPIDVAKKIRVLCALENREISDVINDAMGEYLDAHADELPF